MRRIGMVGLDTSHAVEFSKLFRAEVRDPRLNGLEIVAAYPAGSDLPLSRERVAEYTNQVAAMGVTIVDSLDALLACVDAVMLESVDGSVHLEQAIPILEARKPLFIDKPLAHSIADAKAIQACSITNSVPCFSASSLRFSPNVAATLEDDSLGSILGVSTWGPCHLPEGFPDFYFYGIHGMEVLFKMMGSDCRYVSCVRDKTGDLVRGQWHDGRIGTYRGLRNGATDFEVTNLEGANLEGADLGAGDTESTAHGAMDFRAMDFRAMNFGAMDFGVMDFGVTVFGSKKKRSFDTPGRYRELCIAIADFFRSGIAPVTLSETIEIYEFMDAAHQSHTNAGSVIAV